ncbi:hypothetical protein JMJ77_0009814 [Colletotrichum scovillei]|uniref:Uncharacterized protein n=1 Tax=Colletotrichum scovillei TaxID=1209932 RepID=A0A9P7QYY1_9PEZI|nr:hypothetical protein JMJ77_0009814 [Colletotrichum scovillei]KAG7052901.1 hypothetical protein JMJ78_0005911 [Colletotrichum scovillei]KAG7065190.1 hypothetical protein JMJ76_0012941 [Colletotrichum scovillei]
MRRSSTRYPPPDPFLQPRIQQLEFDLDKLSHDRKWHSGGYSSV